MKTKTRKSFQPSSVAVDSTRLRQKFLTGVKPQDFYSTQQKLHPHPPPTSFSPNSPNSPQDPGISDSILTIKQQGYTREDLTKVFYAFTQNRQTMIPQDLSQLLQDQNQDSFKKYQMIRLLDFGGKGYITLEEFVEFYLEGRVVDQDCEAVPEYFLNKEMWRVAVQENYQLLEKLQDLEYCQYLANQFKRLQDVNLNLSNK